MATGGLGKSPHRALSAKASLNRVFDFFGLTPRPFYLGLAFAHCWLFCMPRIVSELGSRLFSPLLYFGFSGAMLAFALLANCMKTGITSRINVALPWAALGAAGTFCLVSGLFLDASVPIETMLVLLCGASVGCAYLTWASFYQKLSLRQSVLVLFMTMMLGSLLKIPFEAFMPGIPTAALFSLLPLASFACWFLSMRNLPDATRRPNRTASRTKLPLAFYSIGVAMFGVAIGINRSMNASFFDATPATAISHIIEIAMAVAVIVLVYRQQMEFDFSQLWMLILVVIATGLIVGKLPASMAEQVSIATLSSGHLLLVIFYWLSLCDIAHREPVKPSDIVFGIGWPTYALPMAVASFIMLFVTPSDNTALLIVYALLLSVFFLMGKRCEREEALFADLNVTANSEGKSLSNKVSALARNHELTTREQEIALLYAQGRSRSYISKELVLSENTVRDHIASIYRKLGVHNKQEYIDLLQGK